MNTYLRSNKVMIPFYFKVIHLSTATGSYGDNPVIIAQVQLLYLVLNSESTNAKFSRYSTYNSLALKESVNELIISNFYIPLLVQACNFLVAKANFFTLLFEGVKVHRYISYSALVLMNKFFKFLVCKGLVIRVT